MSIATLLNGVIRDSSYVHTLDESAARHILKEHSDAVEAFRGQIPLAKEDLELLPEIVRGFDRVSPGQKVRRLDTIAYAKTYADGITRFVEEVRTGRRKLAAKTMWKERAAMPRATPEEGVAQTSETSRGRVEPAGSGERQTEPDESLQPSAGPESTIAAPGGPVKDPEGLPLVSKLGDTEVPVPDRVFRWLGISPGKVFADYDALHRKHAGQFSSAEYVRDHVEHVLDGPDYAMPATKEEYTLLVRRNGADKATVVEFELRGGKYRVRAAYTFTPGQLEKKWGEAVRRWGGTPRVLARTDESASSSRPLNAPRDAAQPDSPTGTITPDTPKEQGGSPMRARRLVLAARLRSPALCLVVPSWVRTSLIG